jgi:putative tryptophan/tyrosine transport system substrate-binding protein
MDLETDPVENGTVASLARPGGTITGVFLAFADFAAKCLQLLMETFPRLTHVAALWDPTTGSMQKTAIEQAAKSLNLVPFQARPAIAFQSSARPAVVPWHVSSR